MSVEAILLGNAQDGGVPQAECHCALCTRARTGPALRKWVACLGLVDHIACQSWLIDATPDLREQLSALHSLAPDCPLAGMLLTHAHVGHYAGLIHLGYEAWNTRGLPVYASPRMVSFLRENGPWSQLVALDNVRLRILDPEHEAQLSPNLHVTPVPVPHRDEYSDPARRLFYCPDIDGWHGWEHDLKRFVAGMDVALLDGTFFSADELGERDLSHIPHPLVTDTAERLAGVDCDVRLIHLNHSNPLHRPGPERDWLAAQGIGVGGFGARWGLD
jgi:pyrroloquinoline quinone biosynthesis protein B